VGTGYTAQSAGRTNASRWRRPRAHVAGGPAAGALRMRARSLAPPFAERGGDARCPGSTSLSWKLSRAPVRPGSFSPTQHRSLSYTESRRSQASPWTMSARLAENCHPWVWEGRGSPQRPVDALCVEGARGPPRGLGVCRSPEAPAC
jgi:hypothetical protein